MNSTFHVCMVKYFMTMPLFHIRMSETSWENICFAYNMTRSLCLSWQIWDLATGKLKLSLTGHISTVRGVAVSSHSPYLFSCGEDKQVKCWDLEYNKVWHHSETEVCMCVSFCSLLDFWIILTMSFCVLGDQALPRTPQCCVWFRPPSNDWRAGDVQQRCHSEGKLTLEMFAVEYCVRHVWTSQVHVTFWERLLCLDSLDLKSFKKLNNC